MTRLTALASTLLILALQTACGGDGEDPDRVCGDDVCDPDETCDSCPFDCGDCCDPPCDDNATCVETDGGRGCLCNPGYEGDGLVCTDIDECADGTADCAPEAICTHTDDGYSCECPEGYEGDGVTCDRINECDTGTHNCAPDSECTSTEDGYICECDSSHGANCYFALRSLAVIADFADAELEGYVSSDPDAFTSEAAIRTSLDAMTEHWDWMSQGERAMEWDIIRIQLEQDLTPTAFADWVEFRAAAVDAAREVVDFADYDIDGDNILDSMWIIASGRENDWEYLMGGMARIGGAATFVDVQGSVSIRSAATGNFNHEVGHCLGLPDIYGDHDTLSYLTLMSNSWPVPPFGFSAYERMRLDWLEPIVIDETTAALTLRPAEENLEALLITTPSPFEYFLVEHRRRPETGYGSNTDVAFDGLAIYHVYQPRHAAGNNFASPPLIRLEPADGSMAGQSHPELRDFWAPDNPDMPEAFIGSSYYNGEPLIRIDGLAWTDDGIQLDVTRLATTPAGLPNLLANGDFEAGTDGEPEGWAVGASRPAGSSFVWEDGTGRDGSSCLSISFDGEGDGYWQQSVEGLTVGATYELSGWIRTEDVYGATAEVGANLSHVGEWARSGERGLGTWGWEPFAFAFTAAETSILLGCRLGHWWSTVSGTAWFDDLALVELAAE